jgi:hypothetical protein
MFAPRQPGAIELGNDVLHVLVTRPSSSPMNVSLTFVAAMIWPAR